MAIKNEKKYIQKIRQTVGRAINQYKLIEAGDNVLIGVSGGKDSLVLLESLAIRRKYIPISYTLTAIHINIQNISYQIDVSFLEDFCRDLNVPFVLQSIDIDLDKKKHSNPCFICSWNRRRELFEYANTHNFNKLALGHHIDDAIETLLLNMVFHASISSLPPKLSMFDGQLELIRPLMLLTDDQLVEYSEVRKFPKEIRTCPYDKATRREDMKHIISQLASMKDSAKMNMFKAMSNIYEDYLPPFPEKQKKNRKENE